MQGLQQIDREHSTDAIYRYLAINNKDEIKKLTESLLQGAILFGINKTKIPL